MTLSQQACPGRMMPASFGFGLARTPRFETVTAAFSHHVGAQPNVLAARDLTGTPVREATYGELARRSRILAQRLQALGIVPGDRVPLVAKRGIDMLVGIMAILSCGAQYVPLDGCIVPDATLYHVIQQTRGRVALAIRSTSHRLSSTSASDVIIIDDIDYDQDLEGPTLQDQAGPDHGCYMVYSSGTTGTLKGVNITHGNVTNLICTSPGDLHISSGTRVGQVLNISFDLAAWEMLGCLANGGTLVIRGSNWQEALREIDVLICTPSILAKYNPQDYPNIKTVATAGEPSSQRLADTWAARGKYYNCCGPTETTIVNTMHLHQPGYPLTIGRPTPNNNIYILDPSGMPVGFGDVGVMWAGGRGVSSGYAGLEEMTADKYKSDPFTNNTSVMYSTGDLCQWNADGSINHLGRVDDQVKIKGFLVELDGVTASLNSAPSVNTAAALLINGELHAFLTPQNVDIEAVKTHIKPLQPYYATPTRFHVLQSLPLTANGKVDRRKLRQTASQLSQLSFNKTMYDFSKLTFPELVHLRAESWGSSVTDISDMSDTTETTITSEKDYIDLEAAMPAKTSSKHVRSFRHHVLNVYRRLFTIVGLFNMAAAIALVCTEMQREWLCTLTAINLTASVLIRQEFVINSLYTIMCSVPKSWPHCVRTQCAKVFHLGGVHSGAAICAAMWLLASNVSDTVCMATACSNWGQQSMASHIISWMLSSMFLIMFVMAWPSMRKKHHDMFEMTHRFVGWSMLGLFWFQIISTANDTKAAGMSLGTACIRSPPFWLLLIASVSVASPWIFLRKVPVEAEVLSDHAVRLHFDYTVPVNGSFTRLSTRPLLEWHSFATIPAPQPENGRPEGHSLIVSNAGDWTKACIQQPPTHIWIRGVPTCGVMRIATLFNRVVLIATGSGIGPMVGHIRNLPCATKLIWSTSQPEKTFGQDFCNIITGSLPDAVIHDTKKLGRPDLVQMGYNMAKGFDAEAVIIIANEKITKKVVYGLETRGVPAYGAIWDS